MGKVKTNEEEWVKKLDINCGKRFYTGERRMKFKMQSATCKHFAQYHFVLFQTKVTKIKAENAENQKAKMRKAIKSK